MEKNSTQINGASSQGRLKAQEWMKLVENHSIQEKMEFFENNFTTETEAETLNYLMQDFYPQYLGYLLVDKIDGYFNNSKPFNIDHNYMQEVNRLFCKDITQVDFDTRAPESLDGCSESDYEDIFDDLLEFTDDRNFTFFSALSYIDELIGQDDISNSFSEFTNYAPQYNREFRNRDDKRFSIDYLKSIMPKEDYENYLVYSQLYLIDEKIDNCCVFEAGRDYQHELKRQDRLSRIEEFLDNDASYLEIRDKILFSLEMAGHICVIETWDFKYDKQAK